MRVCLFSLFGWGLGHLRRKIMRSKVTEHRIRAKMCFHALQYTAVVLFSLI